MFDFAEADGVSRGTKVIIHLKDDCKRYALKTAVEGRIFNKIFYTWLRTDKINCLNF
jgi:hypothetical protein